jgi:DNA mismatch endonuclease, patch repair protein
VERSDGAQLPDRFGRMRDVRRALRIEHENRMMVDRISQERRSWNMSRIQGQDTAPELKLRSLLHRAGYRFRLHDRKLPGRPDIVMKKYRTAIFVHGCYWHRHRGCPKAATPKSRTDFWQKKFAATVERDKRKAAELRAMGWKVISVWECELEKNPEAVLADVCSKLKAAT